MPKLVLASSLTRWLSNSNDGHGELSLLCGGTTLRAVLDDLFRHHPGLRGYVLDDQNVIRHHVAVFIDGIALADKTTLDVNVDDSSEIYIMQALSGG